MSSVRVTDSRYQNAKERAHAHRLCGNTRNDNFGHVPAKYLVDGRVRINSCADFSDYIGRSICPVRSVRQHSFVANRLYFYRSELICSLGRGLLARSVNRLDLGPLIPFRVADPL